MKDVLVNYSVVTFGPQLSLQLHACFEEIHWVGYEARPTGCRGSNGKLHGGLLQLDVE